jgi:hypothetical protein
MIEGLTLSYAETEALVRVLHVVGDRGEKALLARFKYFQRMGFPHRPKVGRGSRVGYGFEDVMQLVLAFQLMELWALPVRIVESVRRNWPELREAIGTAAVFATGGGGNTPPMIVLAPQALARLGEDETGAVISSDALELRSRSALGEWLEPPRTDLEILPDYSIADADRQCVRVMIDPVRLVRLIRSVLPRVSQLDAGAVDEALIRMAG